MKTRYPMQAVAFHNEQWGIVAYLDGLQAKVNVVRELQSASGEELSALMPSILDKAFKGEL
jgi:type I restriction enzyme, S subunit